MPGEKKKLRLAVLVSGGGTNLQAILDRISSGRLSAEVVVVAGDRPGAYGLIRAARFNIPTHVVDYARNRWAEMEHPCAGSLPFDLDMLDRQQKILKNPDVGKRLERLARLALAENELAEILDAYRPDYICLAGFMRLLTPYFLNRYNRPDDLRVVNIHPALLPSFPGAHGYEDTFAYGARWGGVTVHFADEGEDSGPVIAQAAYPIWPEDDLETIRRRGLELEYEVYSQCIEWLAAGQVEMRSSPGGRRTTAITDPSYRSILRRWMEKAFS